jgi:serine/threonine protein kinase
MAKLIRNGDYMTEGERKSAEKLAAELPSEWIVVTNKTFVSSNGVAREIDLIVVASNHIFVIDEKGCRGRIHGNDQYWVFDSGESCENPLNKADAIARALAGLLRNKVPQLANLSRFVESIVLLSDASCDFRVQDSRRERILRLDAASESLKKMDRKQSGNIIGSHRNAVVEKLHFLPQRRSVPKSINLFSIVEELSAGPFYRSFKAEHRAGTGQDLFKLKLYEVSMGSEEETKKQKEIIFRDYRATAKLAGTGRTLPIEMPFEWDEGKFIVVAQKIPSLPSMRYVVETSDEKSTFKTALKISQQLLLALSEMHDAGIVHRNLTPDNIYIDVSKEFNVLFSDFDFSRLESEETLTGTLFEPKVENEFVAPEIQLGIGHATQKSDMYAAGKIIKEILINEEKTLEQHQNANYIDDWKSLNDVVDSMISDDVAARWEDAKEAYDTLCGLFLMSPEAQITTNSSIVTPQSELKHDSKSELLDGRYKIIRQLGKGGSAVTYLGEDVEFGGYFALKKINDLNLAQILTKTEFEKLRGLNHPRIVRVYDAYPAEKDCHLKMEYVEGKSLKEHLDEGKWNEFNVRKLIDEILEGLHYLEEKNVAHRDLSLKNIILTPHGAKLIDFGLAQRTDEFGNSNVGTLSFRAPELDSGGQWNSTCDLYSVGVIGLTMLLGQLPYSRNADGLFQKGSLIIPEDLGEDAQAIVNVLLKAVSEDTKDRYQNVTEFKDALSNIDSRTTTSIVGEKIINDWVTQIQSLYRNSVVGNADNRGLDTEFARETYVPTKLDNELLPEVIRGKYSIVLLSGNPGDGKTAFLEMVFTSLSRQSGFNERLRDENGWEVDVNGHIFQANYDASESHGDLRSDDLLTELFEPFEGFEKPKLKQKRTLLVAINDGKMREFLLHKAKYNWVGKQISWFTGERRGEMPQDLVVVDLKQRSIVSDGNEPDLFEKVLDSLVKEEKWSICNQCQARENCSVKFNRDSLFEPKSVARKQLRGLLQVSHLRRERHITIRDLRSTLAYILVGDSTCQSIHSELQSNETIRDWTNRLYFNAAFNPNDVSEENLSEFAQCDPIQTTFSRLDRTLWHLHKNRKTASLNLWCVPVKRSEKLIHDVERISNPIQWMETAKRRVFFEGNTDVLTNDDLKHPDPSAMFPYQYFQQYIDLVTAKLSLAEILPNLCEGISRANGISDDSMRGEYLCVRTNFNSDQDLTVFKRFPIQEFKLNVVSSLSGYIEKLPNALELEHQQSHSRLLINLDLFEILMRMNEGYLPGSDEQRPYLIDLNQFEHRLLNEPAHELLLLESGRMLHRVRNSGGQIQYMGTVS